MEFQAATDHIEFLNQDLIHELENDEESRIYNGKLHTSYWFDEYKKDSQKHKNNSISKKSKLKRQLKDECNRHRQLLNLKKFVESKNYQEVIVN